MLKWFDSNKRRQKREAEASAYHVYRAAIEQARNPYFYTHLGVSDTVDGRFDLVVLHVFLLLNRLKREGQAGGVLGQALFDLMVSDFDQNLREMGVGDHGISHRLKKMTKAFYGRASVYDAALAEDTTEDRDQEPRAAHLGAALARNVYRSSETAVDSRQLQGLTRYVEAAVAHLQDRGDFGAGAVDALFPDVGQMALVGGGEAGEERDISGT